MIRSIAPLVLALSLIGCPGAASRVDDDDDDAASDPVIIDNLSVLLTDEFECFPNFEDEEVDCANYSFSFVLRNRSDLPVARITRVQVDIGALEISTGAISCTNSAWLPGPGTITSILDLRVTSDGRFASTVSMTLSGCDGGSGTTTRDMRTDGNAELIVDGLLEDGEAWSSAVTVEIEDAAR